MIEVKLYKNFPINDYSNQVYYGKSASAIARRDSDFDSYADKDFKELASCNMSEQIIRLKMEYYVGNQYNYGVIIKDGHRYYFFVDGVEWLSNEKVVKLHYRYDWWQTYCHRVDVLESFVEREHVDDDTFGKHIIDEGLPVDEYVVDGNVSILDGNSTTLLYCISASDWSDVLYDEDGNTPLSVCNLSDIEISTQIYFTVNVEYASVALDELVAKNKIDGIVGFYAIPDGAIPSWMRKEVFFHADATDKAGYCIEDSDVSTLMYTKTINKPTSFGSYTPVNNKCFTYPYCVAHITNNNGSTLEGKFELSDNKSQITFAHHLPIAEGQNGWGYLKDYDGVPDNFDYSIVGQSAIELPYVTNTFACYMSANHNALNTQIDIMTERAKRQLDQTQASGILSIIGQAGSGNLGGMSSSFMGTSYNMMNIGQEYKNQRSAIDASLRDMESKADLPHGKFTGGGAQLKGYFGYQAYVLTVTEENIKMIDDYFSMFGYKISQIKVPNLTGRRYWNYVKTAGVNVVGSVPLDALTAIKGMLDGGTTLWHDISKMYQYGNYKRTNTPV